MACFLSDNFLNILKIDQIFRRSLELLELLKIFENLQSWLHASFPKELIDYAKDLYNWFCAELYLLWWKHLCVVEDFAIAAKHTCFAVFGNHFDSSVQESLRPTNEVMLWKDIWKFNIIWNILEKFAIFDCVLKCIPIVELNVM